jgi:hypothetical protein
MSGVAEVREKVSRARQTGPADVVSCARARARVVGICRTGVSRRDYMGLLETT